MHEQVTSGIGWVGKLLLLLSVFFASIGELKARASIKNVATLDERITFARESFEDIYYELVKQGFFDVYYNNNLVVCTKIDERFVQEGEVLLYLIDWLDKRNDRDSRYLLKKLSKFLYLEFYQLLCGVDAQKNQNSTLLRMLKDIYKSKVATPYGITTPFRAVLSKLIVLIFMINLTQMPYEKKREAMAYTLHKIENQFLMLNAGLFEKKIPDETIKAFVQALQTYITQEPLVKPSMVKGVIIAIIIVACLIAAGVYIYSNATPIKTWFTNLADKLQGGFETIGKSMGKGMINEIRDQRLGQQFGQDMIHGIASPTRGQPNPDLVTIREGLLPKMNEAGSQLGGGLVRGVAEAPFRFVAWGARGVAHGAQAAWRHRPGFMGGGAAPAPVPAPVPAPALAPAPPR